MKISLDTNTYSGFMRGEPTLVQVVRSASLIVMPLIVIAELRAGFAAGNRKTANARNLQRFLGTPRVSVLSPDEATTYVYADLFAFLRRQGTPIPANDLWIAALVLQHNLKLCTSDAHFTRIPHLPRC
ncbi:MAG: type II toxin-antitoxin system VapC family toxin [Planctomycetaceae bacterium]